MKLNATERKALALSAFAAACICYAPGQVVSGTALLIASIALIRWEREMLRKEAAEAPPSGEAPAPEA